MSDSTKNFKLIFITDGAEQETTENCHNDQL